MLSEEETIKILKEYGIKIIYKPVAIIEKGYGLEEHNIYEVLSRIKNLNPKLMVNK